MKVIIIGSGMGGLAAAIALRQELASLKPDVQVYERVTDLRPIGAAISVWSNGVKVLNRIGAGEEIAKAGGQMDVMAYRTHDKGDTLCEFSLEPLYERVKQRAYPCARTDLQRMLLAGATKEIIHLGKRCTDYTVTPTGVTATFADGSTATGDMIVLADGTHSQLRNKLAGQPVPRQYVGYVNFNGQIPVSVFSDLDLPENSWTQFVGDGKRVSFMPMGKGRFYFFLDVVMPAGSKSDPSKYQDELREYFSGWCEPVSRLIEKLDPTKVARTEIHDIAPMKSLIGERVVLIGDAAHGTAPDLGQGGCQAMEDGWVLARCLKKRLTSEEAKVEEIQAALEEYDEMRATRVAELVTRARKRAEMTHALKGLAETTAWYGELKAEDGKNIMEGIAKTILGAPADLDISELAV